MTKPWLLVTVDTELTWFPQAQGLWGRVSNREYGVPYILEIFRELDINATFFLDVYGGNANSSVEQQRAAELIASHGQDIQLHTHPDPAFDECRKNLNQYSLAEQKEILSFGRERILQWTGTSPTIHRAGSWAANSDTLTALQDLGFIADFSGCLWGRYCQIDPDLINGNGWFKKDRLLCGVGTCYRDGLTGRVRRMDIGGCSFHEVMEILAMRINPLILTLHSFSFLKYNKKRTRFGHAVEYVTRFKEFFEQATHIYGYESISTHEAISRICDSSGDLEWRSLPRTSGLASASGLIHSFLERLKP